MINFAGVVNAIKLAGSSAPAFKALFDQVVTTFSTDQQDELKALYSQARQRSDEAHEGLQQAARDRQNRP